MRSCTIVKSLIAACLVASTAGCVKKSTHRSTLDELARARAEQRDLREEMRARLERCEARIEEEVRIREASEARLHEQVASAEVPGDR